LRVLGDGVTTQVTDLGAGFGVVGMNAADQDLDGDADLFVTTTASQYVKVYYNSPHSTPFFSATPNEQIAYQNSVPNSTAAPGMKTSPLVADFDHDGDIDLVLPVDRTATGVKRHVTTVRGSAVDETSFHLHRSALYIFHGTDEASFQMEVGPPTESTVQMDATHVDVWIWRQQWHAANGNDPAGLGPIDVPGRHYRFAYDPEVTNTITAGLEGNTTSTFDDAYRIIIEPLRIVSGVVTQRYPAYIGSLAASDTTLAYVRNDGEYWSDLPYDQAVMDENQGGQRDDGGFVGKPDTKPVPEGSDPGTGGTNEPPPPPPNSPP
jgi:hypothetical protein